MELPVAFEISMKEMLGADYENYLASFSRDSLRGIRVNTSKVAPDRFLELSPYCLKQVPWCKNGFYYEKKDIPAKHPYYFAGLYYIQEPSAMVTANFLPIEKGDVVLDLCAAPGGKSTELAAKLEGTGLLVSNDVSYSRAKALLKNIEMFGAGNVLVTSEQPHVLAKRFPAFFDKILIDAPCSGEGMFRRQASMIKAWGQDKPGQYQELQRSILKEAVTMLKPGGMLIYSTCTFSKEEDEQSVEYLLSLDNSLHLQELPMIDGFDRGHPKWGLTDCEELTKCRRLWPHRVEGEGHFVALLQKDREERLQTPETESHFNFSKNKLTKEAAEFIQSVRYPFAPERIDVQNDRVYYIPEKMPDVSGLRLLRCGLYMGDIKKNRFEPSQSFAMFLKADEFPNVFDMPVSDGRVIKYLKGETILLSPEETCRCSDGICLICVDGFSLGFGKLSKGTMKNKYLPGWRWM